MLGGYAVAFHGHPRYTKDLDVWLEPSEENAEKVMRALNDFGFGEMDLTKEDFLQKDKLRSSVIRLIELI